MHFPFLGINGIRKRQKWRANSHTLGLLTMCILYSSTLYLFFGLLVIGRVVLQETSLLSQCEEMDGFLQKPQWIIVQGTWEDLYMLCYWVWVSTEEKGVRKINSSWLAKVDRGIVITRKESDCFTSSQNFLRLPHIFFSCLQVESKRSSW